MSHLKPDYLYDPQQNQYIQTEKKTERETKSSVSGTELLSVVKGFADSITDVDMYRFYGYTSLAFRTNTNVFDSVAFWQKFSDGFISALKKQFPDKSPEQIVEIENLLNDLEKKIAFLLKNGNVENKYLLALTLGMMEGMLNYDSY